MVRLGAVFKHCVGPLIYNTFPVKCRTLSETLLDNYSAPIYLKRAIGWAPITSEQLVGKARNGRRLVAPRAQIICGTHRLPAHVVNEINHVIDITKPKRSQTRCEIAE